MLSLLLDALITDYDDSTVVGAGLIGGILSLIFALVFTGDVLSFLPDKNKLKKTIKISDQIAQGADAFLRAEYTQLAIFVLVVFLLIGFFVEWETAACFIVGAILSAISGYLGMKIATKANIRTAIACDDTENGLNSGLKVAFKSGAVMALSVVGNALVGLSVLYFILGPNIKKDGARDEEGIWAHLSGFAFGASSIALFARVGGGIYTKAADVGADLVGKVEEDLEEDSPDNPATIADNVGDNVGDVAGMGADLFESFVGSIIAAATLAQQQNLGLPGISLPFYVAGFGALCSIIGTFMVRAKKPSPLDEKELEGLDEKMKKAKESEHVLEALLGSIRFAIYGSSFLVVGVSVFIIELLFGTDSELGWEIYGCVLIGLLCGNLIGYFTEYATSYTYYPTQSIGHQTNTGPATVIMQGLGVGMLSAIPPVFFIAASIIGAYSLADVYGIAVAAVGMLSTLGVTLATDAYGPVADNAGGIAEMAPDDEVSDYVRETTDALDALGNTTAATGKGFAIGSAVLTALALMNAFSNATDVTTIDILQPEVLAGLLIGALLPFVFASLTMLSVGKAASAVMNECRDQLNQKYFANRDGKPFALDPNNCVKICTQASLQEMVIPGLIAVFAPVVIGIGLGAKAVAGLLIGGISAGFLLAVTMANAGGAWDNAKKWIEKGNLGDGKGKHSDNHKAAVVGDTVGDPFKDTSGPALNILIKLMSIVSLVFAPVIKKVDAPELWWVALIVFAVVGLICYAYYKHTSSGGLHDLEKIDRETKERHNGPEVPHVEVPSDDDVAETNTVKQTNTTEEEKQPEAVEMVAQKDVQIHIQKKKF